MKKGTNLFSWGCLEKLLDRKFKSDFMGLARERLNEWKVISAKELREHAVLKAKSW